MPSNAAQAAQNAVQNPRTSQIRRVLVNWSFAVAVVAPLFLPENRLLREERSHLAASGGERGRSTDKLFQSAQPRDGCLT
mmetsp:Transcript_13860/g.31365  ORF Transcript_13860/g.31365 Transcript_13860/m.31365 type:complete len:80 (-) Transcript_13860:302-541(-)